MTSQYAKTPVHLIQRAMLLGVIIGVALVLLGWMLVPTISRLSVLAAGVILALYGIVFYFGIPRVSPASLRGALIFGLFAGGIYLTEILLEYALLPRDNTSWGIVEFGLVLLLYFTCGLWVAFQTRRISSGVTASILGALVSALIWAVVLLSTLYLFRGSSRQVQVFTAEGNYADFARSGMPDFDRFVMEDSLGAVFFHLLLTPLVASILGTASAMIGKFAASKRTVKPETGTASYQD